MSINTISPNVYLNNNYANKSTSNNSNTYSDVSKNENESEIDKEEDELLYQQLKSEGVDLTNFSFEFQKEHLKAFPPLTAPGNVRRAYRKALENATPEEKKAAQGMSIYMYIYQKQTGDTIESTDNNVDNYLKLMKKFEQYFKGYQGILDNSAYKGTVDFVDNVINELSKYEAN